MPFCEKIRKKEINVYTLQNSWEQQNGEEDYKDKQTKIKQQLFSSWRILQA